MDFFYSDIISNFENCPPTDYTRKNSKCYRWVFEEINIPDNFKSQADKNPSRFNSLDDLKKCEGYALSLYDKEENCIDSFNYLSINVVKNAKKTLGSHIAIGLINEDDGLAGPIDEKGHFNFHPIKNHNFPEKFKIIKPL